jgi:hypothetical protein
LLLIAVTIALVGGFVVVARRQFKEMRDKDNINAEKIDSKLKGLSFSPNSLSGSNISDFFDKANVLDGAVTWAGDWNDLAKKSGGPSLVISKSKKADLVPIAIATTHTDAGQGKVKAIRLLTNTQKESYIQATVDFVAENKPLYIGLGIEVNRIYESSVSDYQWFVDLFNKSVAAIHTASPSTKVFTTFQLERLKGLKGGLFGGQNDENANNWNLLNDFGAADLLCFTSYPGLIYHLPTDMPSDYYASITNHSSKPILFSELGWSAGYVATGWNSTPLLQQQFVVKFFELTSTLESQANIWSFLYDPETVVPFNTMGMFSSDGTERPAWQEFINAKK